MSELDKFTDYVATGKMNRREFIQAGIAAGVSVTAASTAFDKARAATPKKGGKFIQGLTGGGSSDSLDPAQILDSFMINTSSGQLRNNLTEIGPDNQLRGELATEWEASPDAAEWTFKLRKGVEFHNGKTVTAEDVVQSFQHHMGDDTKSAAKGIIAAVDSVTADGDNVVFKLSGGNADFPYICSDYHLNICPAKDGGGIDWESGVGSGAYMLKKASDFEPGVRLTVHRNPNYWKEGAGHFDEIENLFLADANARTVALRTGEIHSMSNLDANTAPLLKRDKNVVVMPTYGNKHVVLPMDCRADPFTDNHVRLALKYAIDRQEMVDKIARGFGALGNDHPIGPANVNRATDDEIPQRDFDADKAKFHLKKAGLDSLNLKLSLADSAFEGAVDAGALYSESARKCGINLEIQREPEDGYWSNVWMKKPFLGGYWGGRPTEDWMFSQVYSSGADWNESFWENQTFNKILVWARAELNPERRRDMYVEMQQICHDDCGSIIPMFMAYTHAMSTKIGLPDQIASNWELDGHKNGERWWFV